MKVKSQFVVCLGIFWGLLYGGTLLFWMLLVTFEGDPKIYTENMSNGYKSLLALILPAMFYMVAHKIINEKGLRPVLSFNEVNHAIFWNTVLTIWVYFTWLDTLVGYYKNGHWGAY